MARRLGHSLARAWAGADAVSILLGTAVAAGVALASDSPRLPDGAAATSFSSPMRFLRPATALCEPAAEKHAWSLLSGDRDLKEISTTRAVLLIARGHTFKDARQAKQHFYDAIENIKKKAGPSTTTAEDSERLTFFLVDDKSNKPLSETLLTRLGIYHDRPFIIILDNFLKTEKKYVSTQVGIPTAKEMEEMVLSFLKGGLQPTMMGQARPPKDRNANCEDLYEVVTDSFDDVVLDPEVDVLLEGYTPKCDACKAFGPRMRMLASLVAKHYGSGRLKIACMNILDNDRPVAYMPEKWTPSLRLFLAGSAGEGGKKKKSVLFRYGSNENSSESAASAASATSEKPAGDGSDEEKVKVTIPSILEILTFIEKETGGRIKVTEELAKEAEALEQEAVILERCYDQALEFMELWAAYSEAIKEQPRRPEILVAAGLPETPSRAAEQATAKQLQSLIIAAYKFLLHEAKSGSAEAALDRLQAVSNFIAERRIGERIEAAYAA
jgi:Thioredoxin